jgi:hypothetical protein
MDLLNTFIIWLYIQLTTVASFIVRKPAVTLLIVALIAVALFAVPGGDVLAGQGTSPNHCLGC